MSSRTPDGKPLLPLRGEDSRLIQELIHDHCGLSYGLDSEYFLERRVGPRVTALGLGSYREYYHYLRYDPSGTSELETLVERLTTHETYLFRESYQLEAFSSEIVPDLIDRHANDRTITVWSAGCSTGEEVYTLAILLFEDDRLRDWNVRVFGSDISRKVVAQARAATYGPSSFRTTPDSVRRRYFSERGGQFLVRDEIRRMCSFGQLNLLTTDRFHMVGKCDVIFCRNVLMYLRAEARKQIVAGFFETMRAGGYLLLGHSESLLNVTTRFDLVHLNQDLVYRRPL